MQSEACFSILAVLLPGPEGCGKAVREEQGSAPGCGVAKDPAYFALIFAGGASHKGAEFKAEGAQTGVTHFHADIRHRHISGNQQLARTVYAQAGQEFMRRLAEGGGKQAMKVKRRKTGFARGLFQFDD